MRLVAGTAYRANRDDRRGNNPSTFRATGSMKAYYAGPIGPRRERCFPPGLAAQLALPRLGNNEGFGRLVGRQSLTIHNDRR